MNILHFRDLLAIIKNRLRVCREREREREIDSRSQAFSLQEHAATTQFCSQLFEAESAVTLAGATAGHSKAETDARASELSSEYSEAIEKIRIFHRSEYVEPKRALDEQVFAQKDAIDVIKREA